MRKLVLFVLFFSMIARPTHAETTSPTYREIIRFARDNVPISHDDTEYFAFSPDGTQIAAAATEATVNVWDIDTGDVVQTFEHASTAVSWSPDGRLIGSGIYNETFRVWDAVSGEMRHEIMRGGRHSSWSPDSRQFVTDSMQIFDAVSGENIIRLGENFSIPYAALWSPDGETIATPGGWTSNHLNLWSTDGERLDTYWAGTTAAWSPDSTRLATARQVRDVATGLPVVVIPEMDGLITWHPDGAWLTSTWDGSRERERQVFLWDANTGDLVTIWEFPECTVRGFAWSNEGDRFAVSCLHDAPDYHFDLIVAEFVP